MNLRAKFVVPAAVAVLTVAFASPGFAMSRHAAVSQCSAKARAQYPSTMGNDNAMRGRVLVYSSCMRRLGQTP
jgi:hypothetical protein